MTTLKSIYFSSCVVLYRLTGKKERGFSCFYGCKNVTHFYKNCDQSSLLQKNVIKLHFYKNRDQSSLL